MNKDKISIQEIIDLVASKANVSKRVAEEFLKVLISTIEDALIAGEAVKIKDFGTFKLQWNAPRKSVNIQTGEEILLSGFHKISFTPENTLKEMVNEPFAHLEAVVLDGVNDEKGEEEEENEVELNPLRIFEEQASEIKNLISEIQALSPRSKKNTTVEKDERIIENEEENILVEELVEELIENNNVSENKELTIENNLNIDVEKNNDDISYISEIEVLNAVEENIDIINDNTEVKITNEIIDEIEQNIDNEKETENIADEVIEKVVISNAEFTSNPFVEELKAQPKSRKGLWITIILLLLLGGSISSYFVFSPATDFVNNTLKKGEKFILTFKESASTTDLLNTISKWFTPKSKESLNPETIVIPKAIVFGDSIIEEEEESVDSLQILFDTPRVYPEYIATEKIVSGSRLARMSERYYGKSDFWVYIYEANQNRIPNPDNIPSGTLIYIPKVDPRLIDATNPRCLKKARELHDLYVKTVSTK